MSPSNNRNQTRRTPVSSIEAIEAADVIVGIGFFSFRLLESFCFIGLREGLGVPGNSEEYSTKRIACDPWKTKLEGMI